MTSHLELEEGNVRHLDLECESFVPARVESVVLYWVRCWLWIPLEVLVVTADNHLSRVNCKTVF